MSSRSRSLPLGLSLGLALATTAGAAHLAQVKDVNTSTAYLSDGLPSRPVVAGAVAYFTGVGTSTVRGLWKTDGSQAGTVLVREFPSGIGASTLTGAGVGDAFFFQASDPEHGPELWTTDGTEAGTILVADIRAGSAGSFPSPMVSFSNRLYFAADDGVNGRELWVTDGSTAGTTLIDIAPGPAASSPSGLRVMGSSLYFAASDGVSGQELWKVDESGTVSLVRDINPGPASSGPTYLAEQGGVLYFAATQAATGNELWKSDGTAAGTVLVRDAVPGTGSSFPLLLTPAGGRVFYRASDPANGTELWSSDGTSAGTGIVKNIAAGSASSSPLGLAELGGALVFSATDCVSGEEPWRSDGTPAGTFRLKDIWAGSTGSTPFAEMVTVGAIAFFPARQPGTGTQLWKTDGTAAGTVPVPGSADVAGGPQNLAAFSGLVLYSSSSTGGRELWKSDGTSAGLVRDINLQRSSSITNATAAGGVLYFSANDGVTGEEPWTSDGTALGTFRVKDICTADSLGICTPNTGSAPAGFTSFGSRVYFSAQETTNGREPWSTDRTGPGTSLLGNIYYSYGSSNPTEFTPYAGSLFFAATSTYNGRELFKSDGTTGGTVFFKDLSPGGTSASPTYLTVAGGLLFFQATTPSKGSEPYVSDGTPAGTVLLKDIAPGPSSSSPSSLKALGSTLFFTATTSASGTELWKSDGTAAGTVQVADINPGTASSFPQGLTPMGTALLFVATDAAGGTELWRTDGTAAGTVPVKDIRPGAASSSPSNLTVVNDTLYFVANDGALGAELWKSDGTEAGTVLVKDIVPGDGTSGANSLLAFGGVLLFSADDGNSGRELWVSDGTGEGTHLVGEIGAGSISAGVAGLTAAAGRVFFRANDGITGSELWSFTNAAPQANAGPDQAAAAGATVTLDGTGSTDPDGDPLRYEWFDAGGASLSTEAVHALVLPVGTHEFRLVVGDGYGATSEDTVSVTVTASFDLTVVVSALEGSTGVVITDPPGEACANDGQEPEHTCIYAQDGGAIVSLQAVAGDPFSVFESWSGACSGDGPCEVEMNEAATVTATFRGPHLLTVIVEGEEFGSGRVTQGLPAYDCFNTEGSHVECPISYPVGTLVSLVAVPEPLSTFLGWQGACSGSGSCEIEIQDDTTVKAVFRGPQPLLVVNQSLEAGSGTVLYSVDNNSCGGVPGGTEVCPSLYPIGTVIDLVAQPDPLSVFVGWSGACTGTGPCHVEIQDDTTVTAVFRGPQPLVVSIESFENGSGTVKSGDTMVCGGTPGGTETCFSSYPVGSMITLTPEPAPDSIFQGWSGACTGTGPCVIDMQSATSVTAVFRGPQTLIIENASSEGGFGSVALSTGDTSCGGGPGTTETCVYQYRIGTFITLTPEPGPDSVFQSLSGACSTTAEDGCTILIEGETYVLAIFGVP